MRAEAFFFPEGISSPAFLVSRVRLEVKRLVIQLISLVDSRLGSAAKRPARPADKTRNNERTDLLKTIFFISSLSTYFEGI
jgi:hypothetical protein